ncbi:MAG: GNAT family N-acetyltransferase [Alphaproteobacteria bacterium]|nr:GNAT family N-acetyltransferase [Alphaproteobacteria bacterium]
MAEAGTLAIRPYADGDADDVRALFVRTNRLLAPAGHEERFEDYIRQSIRDEIGRIPEYYDSHGGSFWVATCDDALAGMFGLERMDVGIMELRRMYVAPERRRRGIAREMLSFAEAHCRSQGVRELYLSTSELQQAALALYRASGYRLLREERTEAASNKTIGGGILRYHLVKHLDPKMADTLPV